MSTRRLAAARAAAAAFVLAATASGCGGPSPRTPRAGGRTSAAATLPDVRIANGRPPLVVVAREGDPASAVALAITTAGLSDAPESSPELAAALAGVLEARLAAAGIPATVVPSWDGYRASWLARTEAEAASAAATARGALLAPLTEADLAHAKKKLAALAARPLRDPALGAWARCTGAPYASAERAPRLVAEATLAKLEASRRAAHGTSRVAIAVVGPARVAEATWSAIAQGAEWPEAKELREELEAKRTGRVESAVYDAALDGASPLEVHLTLEVPTASAAVGVAEALGDARGPLASRLSALDPAFRLREVAGTAHRDHGCVGVVLDVPPGARAPADLEVLAPRVADAVALVHAEARVHLGEGGSRLDGRVLARRAGDVQRAAERAAFWGLVAPLAASPGGGASDLALGGSVALGLGSRRGSSPREARDPATATKREAPLAAAVERAVQAVRTPVVAGRTRVEAGQGEAWLLLASPCGVDAETDVDAGLSAIAALASAEVAEASQDARVEPWITDGGVGLLVHGPPREGESARAHARRLADVVGRAFASTPLGAPAITRARAEVARLASPAFAELGGALAPRHPSWLAPFGREEVTRRASDAAVVARANALRTGPLRLAVLADADEGQADAAVRAVDRWVERRVGEGERACAPRPEASPVRAGTYAAQLRPGAAPEAWLAWPLPAGDAAARDAALVIAAALDGPAGLLERALGGATPLAVSWQARVIGAPRVPALAVRVTARDASLDAAVLQVRALVDRLRQAGLPAPEVEAAARAVASAATATAMDPRARLVATFRGEPVAAAPPKVSADQVREVAGRVLGEDALVVVASRPVRGATP